MKASRIFDNVRGDKYEVRCEFTDSFMSPHWSIYVAKKPKGKRKFIQIVDKQSWVYTKIPPAERNEYCIREYLKEIPWSWVEMVIDDVCAEIRKLGTALYPKDE